MVLTPAVPCTFRHEAAKQVLKGIVRATLKHSAGRVRLSGFAHHAILCSLCTTPSFKEHITPPGGRLQVKGGELPFQVGDLRVEVLRFLWDFS